MTRRRDLLMGLGALPLVSMLPAHAQETWEPSGTMTIIVAAGSGNAFDVLARAAANLWPKYFGVDVIVQNVPGAGGVLGIDRIVNTNPDGQTIGFASSGPYLDQLVEPTFSWGMTEVPIILGIDTPPVAVVTGATSGFSTWEEVRNANRRVAIGRFGKLTVDIPAIRDLVDHGVQVTTASFDNIGPLATGIEAGDIDLWTSSTSLIVMEPIREGRVIPLFVYNDERIAELPDVPTHAELGMPNSWRNVIVERMWLASMGTPQPVVDGIAQRLQALLQDPEIYPWAVENGLIYRFVDGPTAQANQEGLRDIILENENILHEYGG